MKKTNHETTTYEMNTGFMMDIVSEEETYSAYIYHRKYAIKEQMFGMFKNDVSLSAFTKIAAHNFPTFIDSYTENYMNQEGSKAMAKNEMAFSQEAAALIGKALKYYIVNVIDKHDSTAEEQDLAEELHESFRDMYKN